MTYLKDQLTGAVRVFDEAVPKESRRIEVFLKAKQYTYLSKENKIQASPGRWHVSTKAEHTKWLKKAQPVDVMSEEVE